MRSGSASPVAAKLAADGLPEAPINAAPNASADASTNASINASADALPATEAAALIAARTRDLLALAGAPHAVQAAQAADTQLFARLIGAALARSGTGMLGLSSQAFAALCARHFPRAGPDLLRRQAASVPIYASADKAFADALQALLLEHATASGDRADQQCLATIIASACLRPDHLWKDLGLTGREAVSDLLERHFRTLAARNTGTMRWKKFLAMQLALHQGVAPRPAPGCPGCEDFQVCYPVTADAE